MRVDTEWFDPAWLIVRSCWEVGMRAARALEEGGMLTRYLRAAMHRATYKILPDDGTYYGELPGFQGVWANASSLEDCRDELEEVLEEWILLTIHKNIPLPVVDGLDLSISKV
jgi:predicted RNase H-like HicB family nuclease